MTRHEGGCHCGAVRFEVWVTEYRAVACTCSICTKKGFLHLIVPPERFRLLRGAEVLGEYQFGTRTARHLFCRRCGIHAFYRPRSHPEGYSVNVRCLDDVAVERFAVEPFDGRRWEEAIGALRSGARRPPPTS